MCAACVAQGIAYVGGALGGLQVMAARAKARRAADKDSEQDVTPADQASADLPSRPVPVDRPSVP